MSYREELDEATKRAKTWLKKKNIPDQYLNFNSEGAKLDKAPRVPVDANSEFLANRAMGDWAENILAMSLREATGLHVVHYGEADTIAAGEEGFKEFYLDRLENVRLRGKRPDLLIFKDKVCEENISAQSVDALIELVNGAIAAIEVRSSKFEAETYIKQRKREIEAGKKGIRECPSFTVKVEDLLIVYRWHQHHDVPQFYAQVFFDSAYMISVIDILNHIGDGDVISIEKNTGNQLKSTIHIPVTSGTKIANLTELPDFKAERKVTRLGRHDAYVVPVGGELEVSTAALKSAGLAL